ncbi:hypothetical protein [Rhizobium leguminosarum]|uniref:hypothetical protein n=1 Tax=Rhizobium leguminosarum TaxID=384 RepID=UPI00047F974E|nr:hypothetical protein [Rhizobium leguminosarum]
MRSFNFTERASTLEVIDCEAPARIWWALFSCSVYPVETIVPSCYQAITVLIPWVVARPMSVSDRLLLDLMVMDALRDKKGGEFERFFTTAAIELWGDDFEPWKPQGPLGDFKCDGYRISDQTVFQCNAPEQFVASSVASKIERDFEGALANFPNRMQRWVFVHNQSETPARANAQVHKLREDYPDVEIRVWTAIHLRQQIRALSDGALRNLFPGFSPGHEFSEPMKRYLESAIDQTRPPIPTDTTEPQPSNTNVFHETMDTLAEADREVRRRLLGYSRWLDPAPIIEVNARIVAQGFEETMIISNAQRLHNEKLLAITDNHYLSLDDEVCQQAADTLMFEFLAELQT